ncbi:MAG: EF-P lysine aminoacylase EpmA [bacterium]
MDHIKPEIYHIRHQVTKLIRHFFDDRGYLEVTTPMLVRCPGIDPFIDAIPAGKGFYLASSPELHMKRLLGSGLKKIYQITHAFRANESGDYHNCEFSILEWYEVGLHYEQFMDLTESLIHTIDQEMMQLFGRAARFPIPFQRISVDTAFQRYAHWCPSREWNEDRFFFDLVEIVEPALKDIPALFLYDFPAPLASLARLKSVNPALSERFELYLHGIEIANGFSELICAKEQRERFERDLSRRAALNKEVYPLDDYFLQMLEGGSLPDCAGIALGLDRLFMVLTGSCSISEVMAFPQARL